MATQPAEKGFSHKKLERNVSLLGLFALVTVAIGGLVEIAPLFWIDNTVERSTACGPTPRSNSPVATSTSAKAVICATAR